MQTYESKIPCLSYEDMARRILTVGYDSKTTKFRHRASIVFDRSSLHFREIALPKYRLDGSESSEKYALAELMWYASKRLSIGLIRKFGPIWEKMTDDKGKVNSNYGHQVFNNNDYKTKLAELLETGRCVFYIASEDNQHSRTDLVCNNAVELSFNEDKTVLSVRVVARSIDMLYGYPYDLFAAQAFASFVLRQLTKERCLEKDPIIDKVQFDIENVHIYNDHISDESLAKLEMTDFATYKVIEMTEFVWNDLHSRLNAHYSAGSESVKTFRNTFSRVFYEKKLYQNIKDQSANFDVVRFDSMYEIDQYFRTGEQFSKPHLKRVRTVLDHLKQDTYDRKNLIFADGTIYYLTRRYRNLQSDIYEVTKHAFKTI